MQDRLMESRCQRPSGPAQPSATRPPSRSSSSSIVICWRRSSSSQTFRARTPSENGSDLREVLNFLHHGRPSRSIGAIVGRRDRRLFVAAQLSASFASVFDPRQRSRRPRSAFSSSSSGRTRCGFSKDCAVETEATAPSRADCSRPSATMFFGSSRMKLRPGLFLKTNRPAAHAARPTTGRAKASFCARSIRASRFRPHRSSECSEAAANLDAQLVADGLSQRKVVPPRVR